MPSETDPLTFQPTRSPSWIEEVETWDGRLSAEARERYDRSLFQYRTFPLEPARDLAFVGAGDSRVTAMRREIDAADPWWLPLALFLIGSPPTVTPRN